MSKIIKMRKQRSKNLVFYDNYENIIMLLSALKTRLSMKKVKGFYKSKIKIEEFLINKILSWAYKILLPYDFLYIKNTAINILKNIKCKNICMTYEHGIYAKLLMVEAYKQEIDSFGFVHGYMFSKNITPDYANIPHGKGKDQRFLRPKKTFIFGKHQRRSLTKYGGYKDFELKTVGNWKIKNMKIKKNIGSVFMMQPINFFFRKKL